MTETRNSETSTNQVTGSPGPGVLGRSEGEDEAGHLRRVAEELGGANSPLIERLSRVLNSGGTEERMAAAARLGSMGERHATVELRRWLESDDTSMWEVAVHGLRQSRDRSGWLCLESVALDNLDSLAQECTDPPPHAFRLLVMGRTKTMDRLFRATDGHSRAIQALAAMNFANTAVRSVPPEMSEVMAMRLGLFGHSQSSSDAVAKANGLSVDEVRRLESLAWETVQRPRPYDEIMRWFGENSD